MEKIAIILLLVAVAGCADKSSSPSSSSPLSSSSLGARGSKQLFYSPYLFPPNYQAAVTHSHPHLSHLYNPFWSNLQTVPALSKSDVNGHVQDLQLSQLPVTLHQHHHPEQQQVLQLQPQQQQQLNTQLINPVQLSPANSPPLAYSQVYHGNIWNFDDSLSNLKSTSDGGDDTSSAKRNVLSYYFPFPNVDFGSTLSHLFSPQSSLSHDHEAKKQTGFQRGNIESRPDPLGGIGQGLWRGNVGGFVRSHVESPPASNHNQGNMRRHEGSETAGHRPLTSSYSFRPSSFNRGAVEGVPNGLGKPSGRDEYSLSGQTYGADDKKVLCYFANWAWARKGKASFVPENVDPMLCTHVIYAFATYDKAKVTIAPSDNWTDVTNDFLRRIVALKERNPNLKVLLSVGGWADSGDDKYSSLAHSPTQREKFAQESLQFLKSYGFDGLAIDWHYPKCWQSNCDAGPGSDSVAFGDLLRELKSVFTPHGLLLSATLSGYKEVIDQAYHVPTLNGLLDLMNIMTYDYHGAWESTTGHVAPLFQGPPGYDRYPYYNANYTMEYYVSLGADRNKLMMGIPMYGQSFTLNVRTTHVGSEADGPGNPGEYTQQPGMLAFYEICNREKNKGWSIQKETTQSWGPIAYDRTGQWVGYDDPDFVARKSRYVRAQGFGGVFVWTMDLDDFNNDCCLGPQPLLRTIARELLNIPFSTRQQNCSPPPPVSTPATVITTTFSSNRPTTPSQSEYPQESSTASSIWWTPTSTTSTTTLPWWTTSTTPTTFSTSTPPPLPPSTDPSWITTKFPLTTSTSTSTSTQSPPATTTIVLTCHHQTTSKTTTDTGTGTGTQEISQGNECDGSTFQLMAANNDCSTYYQCNYGKLVAKRCSAGLHYNAMAQACDWPDNAKCYRESASPSTQTSMRPTWTTATTFYTTTTQMPPSDSSFVSSTSCLPGEYLPAEECSSYYLCVNGRKMLQHCGPGLHWDKNRRLCDWPSEAKCQNYNKKKPLDMGIRQQPCQEGSYTASKAQCESYFVCVHGENVAFRCQGGLFWNQGSKICDWPSNSGCSFVEPPSENAEMTMRPTMRPTTSSPMWPTTSSPMWPVKPVMPDNSQFQPQATTTRPPFVSPVGPNDIVTGQTSPINSDFMIVCYFTNWAWYRMDQGKYKPDNVNPNLCTHVIYGFAVLDSERLEIKVFDTWADIDNKFYEQIAALKAKGIKVSIAIGGWNDSLGDKYSRLVNNPSARRRFIEHVVQFIRKYNFDGLDLDWEYPKCWQVECDKGPNSDKPNFANLVMELKEAFRPHGYLLSSAVSPSKTVIDVGYDVPTLSRYLDWIAVMTYDFHGQWDKKTGHVAPLYFHEEDDVAYFNTNYSINYWINKGADRRKIVLGMPLYGQSFTLIDPSNTGLNSPSSGGGMAGRYTKAAGFLAYYEICHNVQREGWTVVKDPTGAMGPYAFKGNQWVSYDDVNMIARKSQLIRDLNLGGGMIWALDLDDFRNVCGQGEYPLLTTIKNVLSVPRGQQSSNNPINNSGAVVIHNSNNQQKISGVNNNNNNNEIMASSQQRPPPIKTDYFQNIENDACEDEPFKKHEKDCNMYYQCIFGRYIPQRCPPGTFWNMNRCDWECGDNNQASPPQQSVTTTNSPPPVSTVSKHTTTTTTPRTTTTTKSTTRRPSQQPTKPVIQTTYRPPPPSNQNQQAQQSEFVCPNSGPKPDWQPAVATEVNTAASINVPSTEYKMVCYFTNWAWYRPGIGKYKPSDIDFNLCTHIAYGFAVLDPTNLVLRPHDGWADLDNKFYRQVVQLKAQGLKVVLALGGWNDSLGDKYSRLVNDPSARRKFIDHVIQFLERHCFDGLDLDWEYPKCWQVDCSKGPDSDKQGFADLVREISEAFKPRGLLLSAAVSPSKTVIDQGYDVPVLSRYMDWISVMTYDFHGQWDKKTGHVAPLYFHEEDDIAFFNTNYTINYWINQGADRKKIIMGMPVYGQSFTLVDPNQNGLNAKSSGGGTAGEFTRQSGFLAYYEICRNILHRNWKVVQDDTMSMGPYAYAGNQWVSFDDRAMLEKKSQYIKQMGLGGGMIWALDLDDFRGNCGCGTHPLLKTINRVLRNYPENPHPCNLS